LRRAKGYTILSLEAQLVVFAVSLAIGLGAGFLFDCYRAVGVNRKLGRLVTGLGDLLIWCALTLVVFGLLLLVNWGEVRWYILVGLGLGALVYYRTMSRRGLVFWRHGFVLGGRVARFLVRPLEFAWRMVTKPFGLVLRVLSGLRSKLGRATKPSE